MIFEQTGHGGDIYGRDIRLDFSANINPLGTPDSVKRAVTASADDLLRYPDPCCRELRKKIAAYEEIDPAAILCGSGAAELIYSFCAALRPKRALELAPTFSEYSAALESVGCHAERYPLQKENGFALTEDFLPVLREGAWDAVFLCNPNNPTGQLIEPPLLEAVCRLCAETGARLLLDECFLDLTESGGSMKPFLRQYPNLLILKAFTKNFGMAGLRLGYCLCEDPALLQAMSHATQVWNVSTPAQRAGIAALDEREFLARAKTVSACQRPRLRRGLEALGCYVCPGKANYLLFYSPKPLADALLRRGILIRSCENYHGLGSGWYRIAVKTHEENTVLLSALQEIMEE